MNTQEFKTFIKNAPYTSKYEPIIDIESNEIVAYEALSKFSFNTKTLTTEEIFRKLHHSNTLFFELEKRNKQHQLENYHLDYPLFLNFDADIFQSHEQQLYWEKFLVNNAKNIVVEITENGSDDESSATTIREFSNWLKQMRIKTALDDFGQEGSMFSYHIMNQSDYIKIDKSMFWNVYHNRNYIPYLKGVLVSIRLNRQKSIIEGIETKEQLDFAKHLGVDYVQGYYFDENIIIV